MESYDPWAEYENGKRIAGETPAYLSLLNLLNDIRSEVRVEAVRQDPLPGEINKDGVYGVYSNPFTPGKSWKAPSIQASEAITERLGDFWNAINRVAKTFEGRTTILYSAADGREFESTIIIKMDGRQILLEKFRKRAKS